MNINIHTSAEISVKPVDLSIFVADLLWNRLSLSNKDYLNKTLIKYPINSLLTTAYQISSLEKQLTEFPRFILSKT